MSLRPAQTLKDAIADDGRFVFFSFFFFSFLKISLGGKQSPFFSSVLFSVARMANVIWLELFPIDLIHTIGLGLVGSNSI